MAMRFCPNCGTEVPEGVQFCKECGIRLPSETPRTPETACVPGVLPGNNGKTKRTGLIVAIACVTGALVIGAVVAVALILRAPKVNGPTISTSQSSVSNDEIKPNTQDSPTTNTTQNTSPSTAPNSGPTTTNSESNQYADLIGAARAQLTTEWMPKYIEEQAIDRVVIDNDNVTVLVLGTGTDEVDGKTYPAFAYAILSKVPQNVRLTISDEKQGDTTLTDEEGTVRAYDDFNLLDVMLWYDEENLIGTYAGASCRITLTNDDTGTELGSAEVVFE